MGNLSAEDRLVVRDAVKSERAERRELFGRMLEASPNTKLGKKVGVLLLDVRVFDEWVEGCGGEDAAVRFVCAQVASRVSLTDLAGHYGLDRGLLWAMLSETEERLGRYYRALKGVADEYVGEVVGIADGSSVDDVSVGKLQIEARLKVAEKYDAVRFGKQTRVTHEVNVDFGERLRRAQERVINGQAVEVEDVEALGVEEVGLVESVEVECEGVTEAVADPIAEPEVKSEIKPEERIYL